MRLEAKGYDLRDPKLSIMPDGRLMLIMGGSVADWPSVQPLQLAEEWIWRLTWHQGTGYGISYRYSDPSDMVYRNGLLYISYYSFHEGKSCIYFAQILLLKNTKS